MSDNLGGELIDRVIDAHNETDDPRSLGIVIRNSTRDTWKLIDGKMNEGKSSWSSIPEFLEPGQDAAIFINSGPPEDNESVSATIIYKKKDEPNDDKACVIVRYQINEFRDNKIYDTGTREGYGAWEGAETNHGNQLRDWWQSAARRELNRPATWRKFLGGSESNHVVILMQVGHSD